MKKHLLTLIPLLLLFACMQNQEQEPYILLPQGHQYLSPFAGETELRIETNMDFLLRPIGHCSWMTYQKNGNTLYFTTQDNPTANPRTCRFLILNENCHLSDTLTLIQSGNPDFLPPAGSTGEETGNGSASGGNEETDSEDDADLVGRCAAITKQGTRCKRKAAAGSIYCWQHQKS